MWLYSDYGIVFDDFAKNVVIFGVDNSSSSRADNRKNTC